MISSSACDIQVERIVLAEDFPVSSPEVMYGDGSSSGHPHVHDALELGYCRSGSGVCMVGGQVYSYKSGDCSFIDTHEIHFFQGNLGEVSRWDVIHLDPMGVLGRSGLL